MNIIITGASGFIGRALCQELKNYGTVVALDRQCPADDSKFIRYKQVNIEDTNDFVGILKEQKPDIIVHCAGVAHQKLGGIGRENYFSTNSYATEALAKIAGEINPDVHFIFLSSISVYGEENNQSGPFNESNDCRPSSDYASSKLDAENRLLELHKKGELKKLDILRLSPVYDSNWGLNLERRVLGPGKKFYIKFGSGNQRMSAISRQNLIEFISFIAFVYKSKSDRYSNLYNVCDETAYSFDQIIKVLKNSNRYLDKPVLTVPLSIVWILVKAAGAIIKNKRNWLHSCYHKLANDLVFDNNRMLETGFRPVQNLKDVYLK